MFKMIFCDIGKRKQTAFRKVKSGEKYEKMEMTLKTQSQSMVIEDKHTSLCILGDQSLSCGLGIHNMEVWGLER